MTTQGNPEILDNDEHDTPGGMRATIDRLNDKIKDQEGEIGSLVSDKRVRTLDDSGLTGPALKAVSKDLDRGDYTGDVTAEALREYAEKEYDWEPPTGDDDGPAPNEVDEATRKRMDSQESRDDLAASSHARGDEGEVSPESQQAAADTKLDEGDVQGAVLDEITAKVTRAG